MKKLIFIIVTLLFAGVLYGQFSKQIDDFNSLNLVPELLGRTLADGKLTLSLSQYHQNPPDSIGAYTVRWIEVYIAKDGKIVLDNILEGKYRTVTKEIEEQELYYEK